MAFQIAELTHPAYATLVAPLCYAKRTKKFNPLFTVCGRKGGRAKQDRVSLNGGLTNLLRLRFDTLLLPQRKQQTNHPGSNTHIGHIKYACAEITDTHVHKVGYVAVEHQAVDDIAQTARDNKCK